MLVATKPLLVVFQMTVPKKIDKFNNFVSNSFKIKDDAVSRRDWCGYVVPH